MPGRRRGARRPRPLPRGEVRRQPRAGATSGSGPRHFPRCRRPTPAAPPRSLPHPDGPPDARTAGTAEAGPRRPRRRRPATRRRRPRRAARGSGPRRDGRLRRSADVPRRAGLGPRDRHGRPRQPQGGQRGVRRVGVLRTEVAWQPDHARRSPPGHRHRSGGVCGRARRRRRGRRHPRRWERGRGRERGPDRAGPAARRDPGAHLLRARGAAGVPDLRPLAEPAAGPPDPGVAAPDRRPGQPAVSDPDQPRSPAPRARYRREPRWAQRNRATRIPAPSPPPTRPQRLRPSRKSRPSPRSRSRSCSPSSTR